MTANPLFGLVIRTIARGRIKGVLMLCLLAICDISCNSKERLSEQFAIQNVSTNHWDRVKVDLGGREFDAGFMSPGSVEIMFGSGLPVSAPTNIAVIKFISQDAPGLDWKSGSNEEVRAQRSNSWTSLPVDASRLLQLDKKLFHITFRILSATNADVLVEKIQSR